MEWYYYDKREKSTKGCLAVFLVPTIVISVILISMKTTAVLTPAPKVRLDEEEICVNIKSRVLYDELVKNQATEYFELSKPTPFFGGSFRIACKPTETAKLKFNHIFLTDSAAYHMCSEYPHLFQLNEEKMIITLDSHNAGRYTTIPAWLIVRLVEERLLTIPEK